MCLDARLRGHDGIHIEMKPMGSEAGASIPTLRATALRTEWRVGRESLKAAPGCVTAANPEPSFPRRRKSRFHADRTVTLEATRLDARLRGHDGIHVEMKPMDCANAPRLVGLQSKSSENLQRPA